MAAAMKTEWLVAGGVVVVVVVLRARAKRKAKKPWQQTLRNAMPAHGLSIEDDHLRIVDWSSWIYFAQSEVNRAVAEGAATPEHVMARVFYKAFPAQQWPPEEDSPLAERYRQIEAIAGAHLGADLRAARVEQAKTKQGLHIVEDDE